MDREVAETLAYFRENASDLKQLGKEWGLSDADIKECIQRAMSMDPEDLPQSKTTRLKFAARKSWPKLRILLWIVGLVAVFVGVVTLALQNEQIDHRVGQIVQPLLYPFFRTVRLAATPLHDIFDLYDNFMELCFVRNPLYDKNTQLGDHACELCNTVKTVTQFTAQSMKQGPLPGAAFTEPVLVKGKGQNVSLETFQSILSNNPFIKLSMQGVTTDLKWASQVKDLMGEDVAAKLAAQPDFYFFWVSKLPSTSQIMRKVFTRPDIFGPQTELAIKKTIYITGPKFKSFDLVSNSVSSFSWYEQGWGSKEVELTPADMCHKECSPVLVMLHAGDILMYNSDLYTATLKPVGENISISFLGHFTPRDF